MKRDCKVNVIRPIEKYCICSIGNVKLKIKKKVKIIGDVAAIIIDRDFAEKKKKPQAPFIHGAVHLYCHFGKICKKINK